MPRYDKRTRDRRKKQSKENGRQQIADSRLMIEDRM
jgi:hypothetical protein